ncbi:MAG: carboxypeptidase M32, partial [Bacilli bacterium]
RIIATLSEQVYEMKTAPQLGEMLKSLEFAQEHLSATTKTIVKEVRKEYDYATKVPQHEYVAYVETSTEAETVWEEAKQNNDFSLLAPYLEKLVEYNKKFATYWRPDGDVYDTLLDIYEPGITQQQLDAIFNQIKASIVPLLQRIVNSEKQPNIECLSGTFPKDRQIWFNKYTLGVLNYDFDGGRLDETEHPFQITIHHGDARVTTKYKEDNWQMALFGTIHECGHAYYEQNIDPKWQHTPISGGASMGIHESQSLFFENIIGRNKSFWKKHYGVLQDLEGKLFKDVSLEEFYASIHHVSPSFIRIEADEVTYVLHIIVRYELEKALFNGSLSVADLPNAWREKMKELLGVEPPNDQVGVLQDVHWSGGSFGYFPSYALGYMYAAQFLHTIEQQIASIDSLIASADEMKVLQWLTEHVHQFGKSKTPADIVKEATGEALNPQYFINYLEKKYSNLYDL